MTRRAHRRLPGLFATVPLVMAACSAPQSQPPLPTASRAADVQEVRPPQPLPIEPSEVIGRYGADIDAWNAISVTLAEDSSFVFVQQWESGDTASSADMYFGSWHLDAAQADGSTLLILQPDRVESGYFELEMHGGSSQSESVYDGPPFEIRARRADDATVRLSIVSTDNTGAPLEVELAPDEGF